MVIITNIKLLRCNKASGIIPVVIFLGILVGVASVALVYVLHGGVNSGTPATVTRPAVNEDLRTSIEFLSKRGFDKLVLIDENGVIYRAMLRIFGDYNVTIYRHRSLDELDLSKCPRILVINLLDDKIYSELNNPSRLDKIRECSEKGNYVLFVLDNVKVGNEIWMKLFGVVYPNPSSEVTVTMGHSSSKVDYYVAKKLFISGRTYKVINDRSVPVDVGGSAIYKSTERLELEDVVSVALIGLIRSIADTESRYSGH